MEMLKAGKDSLPVKVEEMWLGRNGAVYIVRSFEIQDGVTVIVSERKVRP